MIITSHQVDEMQEEISSNLYHCWNTEFNETNKLSGEQKVLAFLVVPTYSFPCPITDCEYKSCDECLEGYTIKMPDNHPLIPIVTDLGTVRRQINNYYAIIIL